VQQGIVQVRFESGLEEILELHAADSLTMAETTAYFEAYRHVLEGLKEMKKALPMKRLVDILFLVYFMHDYCSLK
jgi:hypothetical protein